MLERLTAYLILCLFLQNSLGCSAPTTVQVTGTVNLDGKPLEKGSIQFTPVDGKGGTGGGEIVNGKIKAVSPIAKMKVEIYGTKVVDKRKAYDTPDSPLADVLAEVVPPRYNRDSTIVEDIREGVALKYELKSD